MNDTTTISCTNLKTMKNNLLIFLKIVEKKNHCLKAVKIFCFCLDIWMKDLLCNGTFLNKLEYFSILSEMW